MEISHIFTLYQLQVRFFDFEISCQFKSYFKLGLMVKFNYIGGKCAKFRISCGFKAPETGFDVLNQSNYSHHVCIRMFSLLVDRGRIDSRYFRTFQFGLFTPIPLLEYW